MSTFIPGQRWLNYAELTLGLGTVLSVDLRTVTLVFLASGETRTYAMQSAPLNRVRFNEGDTIRGHAGTSIRVSSVQEQDGLLIYKGIDETDTLIEIHEGELDSHVQLNHPAERLFTGQLDDDAWFELRYQTLLHQNRLGHSSLRGLTGGRTSLIPHQLYIAHEVANRHAPRVLLADEVGLGKTIEAGLILHQQLLTERAQRVLIVVPESLLHQWLVEMLRRFNLSFSVLDEERCLAICESSGQENPFHSEQLVLCTLEFLLQQPQRHTQAVNGEWDLLVIDEAHHLQWSPEAVSEEYRLVEQLAQHTRGVLLLTATPEQLGKQSHFARLRLLDPDRFPDYQAFIDEERDYVPIATAVEALLDGEPLNDRSRDQLQQLLTDSTSSALLEKAQSSETDSNRQARLQLVDALLDRHGTGRVLFRNTRSAIKGFPKRTLRSYPLALPDAYSQLLNNTPANDQNGSAHPLQLLLCPELLYQSLLPDAIHWTKIDPRVEWLSEQLRSLRPEKILVITASADTSMDLAAWLHSSKGIHAAVFHEGMSLIERDRAAAYFADLEFGTQVLVCSEIGSEGRNFQFAHHLVLFDLPLNPDLLEQRIGRLDRIGQLEDIRIHIPYLQNTAQAIMLRWYHEGLDAFEHICPAAQTVYSELGEQLVSVLQQQTGEDTLIEQTSVLHAAHNAELQRGRDRLLEYSSCRAGIAAALCKQAAADNSDNSLHDYLEQLVECYGLELEPHSEGSHILRPGDHMHSHFPGLRDEGITFTCSRDIALANEDREFFSWEHPLICAAMEMIPGSESGNTAITTVKYRGVKPGTLMLECLYTLDAVRSELLQTGRYLPATTIRILADQYGKDHSALLSHSRISVIRETIPADTAAKIIRGYSQPLRDLLKTCEQLADQHAPALIMEAREQANCTLGNELDRLRSLAQVNRNVRPHEIGFMEQQAEAVSLALESASFRLDALRVIVAT